MSYDYDEYEEEDVQPLPDSVEIHKYDIIKYYMFFGPDGDEFGRIFKPIAKVKPFDPYFPEGFSRDIEEIPEDEIDSFIEHQYELCNSKGKSVFVEYILSLIDQSSQSYYKVPLKCLLIKKRLERGFFDNQPDNRIRIMLPKNEIRKYFLELTEKQKNSKPVLSEEEVDYLLRANFVDFEPRVKPIKFNTPNSTQTNLIKFVYKFYKDYSGEYYTDPYAELLKNNFILFDNTSLKTIKSNFSKYYKKKKY